MNYIFRNVPNFKYLGKEVTNYIYEDVKSKLNSDIHAAIPFRIFFFHILRVNVIIKVYTTLICCFIWVCNSVSHSKGKTKMENI
jgi:hypothetical protein